MLKQLKASNQFGEENVNKERLNQIQEREKREERREKRERLTPADQIYEFIKKNETCCQNSAWTSFNHQQKRLKF